MTQEEEADDVQWVESSPPRFEGSENATIETQQLISAEMTVPVHRSRLRLYHYTLTL